MLSSSLTFAEKMANSNSSKIIAWLALVAWIYPMCTAYRFLCVPILARSHMMEQVIIARELVSRGHEVHMVVTEVFPMEETIQEAGIKVLRAKKPGEVLKSAQMSEEADKKFGQILRESSEHTVFFNSALLHRGLANDDCRNIIHDKDLLEQIKSLKFDLALVDSFPIAPCSALLPYHLGIPFAAMFSTIVPAGSLPVLPSFVPFPMSPVSDRMTFLERTTNLFSIVSFSLFPVIEPSSYALLEEFPDPSGHHECSWTDLLTKSSLFFATRDHILEVPMPSMPYYVMLPGITQQPAKPLEIGLENYMTSAPGGVFVVSFGSIINELDISLIQRLFAAFRTHADLRFLFRLSGSDQKLHVEVPPNVRLMTWLPQNDVLGHKNTRGFITHCGNNGQHEAVYHGVPMIGIPMSPEQNHNCHRILVKNLGLCLEVKHFTVEDLYDAISRLMTDDSFRDSVQRLSSIMKEDDLPPTKAAHWLEHVAKYGSGHLRSTCLDLPWYQYWLVDVITFMLIVTVLVCVILYKCCKRICCRGNLKAKEE